MRWRVAAAPSTPPRWNAAAPGTATWHAELFRARAHAPGEWMLCDDNTSLAVVRDPDIESAATPDSVRLVRPTVGRSLAARVHP
jgi:protein ImuA